MASSKKKVRSKKYPNPLKLYIGAYQEETTKDTVSKGFTNF